MTDSGPGSLDIGEDAAETSREREPGSGRVVDRLQRRRVQQALFGESSSSFELGRYAITGTLGSGGMGVVFEAFDPELDRRVALKVLRAELDERHTIRLRREAQAMAKLSHPNVVQVHEVGRAEGQTFVAMELVAGQTLGEWMRREPRPTWRECVEVFIQVGGGLAAAHERGLVHRDFKPGNAIIDEEGRPRVLDFGLVRQAGDTEEPSSIRKARTEELQTVPLDVSLTKTGAVLGTPAYMPPEQMDGREADARSDQFSYCVALWEAVYGERPFEGSSMAALMVAMAGGDVRPAPKGSPVPGRLRAVLKRGLAVDPAQRWPSMKLLLAELQRQVAPRRGARQIVLGLGLLGSLAAAQALWPEAGPCEAIEGAPAPAWTSESQDAVERGLLAVGLPYASKVAPRVAEGLERYAREWTDARYAACEATHVEHTAGAQTYELRLACLDRRMQRMSALVHELSTADARVMARAVQAVHALPSISPCSNAEGLQLVIDEVPEGLEATNTEARQRVSEAWALHQSGNSSEGAERAQQAVMQAESLGDNSVTLAEALLVRGQIHHHAWRLPAARRDYHAALERAERTRNITLELDILQQLALLSGREQDRSTAEAWLVQARGKLAHVQDEPRRRIALEYAKGYVARWTGEYAKAIVLLEDVVEDYRTREGDEPELAEVLGIVGAARTELGELEEALEAHTEQRAIASDAGAYGVVATAHHDIARVHIALGDLDAAEENFGRAVDLSVAIYGEGAPTVVPPRMGLAQVHMFRGDTDAAIEQAERALRSLEGENGAGDDMHGQVMLMLGALHMGNDENDEAIRYMERARTFFEGMPEPEPLDLAMIDSNIGDCYRRKGATEEAVWSYGQAMERLRTHAHPGDARWVYPLLGMGILKREQGEPRAAIDLLSRAYEKLDTIEVNPGVRAELEWEYGRLLVETEMDKSKGMELILEGRRGLEDDGQQETTKTIDAWLSECGKLCL